MVLNKMKQLKKDKGFTIVELLIVIVVIAILAAITIVAYGGITARANASTAKANAESIVKVVEAYAADSANSGAYPTLLQLTGYNGITHVPSALTVNSAVLTAASAGTGTTIQYVPLTTTGGCIGYWDASLGTPQPAWMYAGVAKTGTNAATPTCA